VYEMCAWEAPIRGWFYTRPATTRVKVVKSRCGGSGVLFEPI